MAQALNDRLWGIKESIFGVGDVQTWQRKQDKSTYKQDNYMMRKYHNSILVV